MNNIAHACLPRYRTLRFVFALMFFGVAAACGAETTWPEGTIQQSCASWDGSAFLVLTKREDGQYLRLQGFDSLAHAEGRWPIKMGGRVGEGDAAICTQERSTSTCLFGKSGHFSVRRIDHEGFEISYAGSFVHGLDTVEAAGHFRVKQLAPVGEGASSVSRRFCG